MPTKFQLEYLIDLVEKALKGKKDVLLAQLQPDLEVATEDIFADEGSFAHDVMVKLSQLQNIDQLLEKIRVQRLELTTAIDATFKERLSKKDYDMLNLGNTVSYISYYDGQGVYQSIPRPVNVPAKREYFRKAVQQALVPAVAEKVGIAEQLEKLEEQGRDVTTKIMVATSISALRKAVEAINKSFGLDIQL